MRSQGGIIGWEPIKKMAIPRYDRKVTASFWNQNVHSSHDKLTLAQNISSVNTIT